MRMTRFALMAAGMAVLAACSQGEPRLMNLRSATPDEFAVLPYKKPEIPENVDKLAAELPPPRPGGRNRVDVVPEEDAQIALGGRPADRSPGRIPAADAPLVKAVARYGTDPAIREKLAAEDLEWRKAHRGRPLERLFGVNVYFKAYEPMALDPWRELKRLRRAGIWTPTAPPKPAN